MKVLFITANRVGDAVLTTGLLSWMEKTYPSARFTIACGPYGADLFRATPRLERLIIMKKKKWNGHWIDLWKQCIGTKWDLIVDLRNSVVSRLLHVQKYVHYSKASGKHKVIDNADILGLNPPPDPHIWLSPEAEKEASRLLPKNTPILALGPAANWPAKQWPVDHFMELAKRLTRSDGPMANAAIMILADKHERDQITPLLNSIPEGRRIEIIGRDLQIVAASLKQARLYVGNDSGLMHLSAALGVPTLGLFGPGFPHIYGPWGKKCAFVSTPESREELLARLKPGEPTPSLMQSLQVECVFKAATELLTKTA